MADRRSTRLFREGVTWFDPSAGPRKPLTTTSRLLLPVDGTELSERVIALGRRLLEPHGEDGRGVLLHVVPPPSDSQKREHEVARARERLENRIRELPLSGPKLRAWVSVGDPAEEILRSAAATDSKLIVMASHGRQGIERLVRGSVAEEVLRTTRVPLLLCNPHELRLAEAAPFLRILVPLDGSERAAAILPLVEELAGIHGSEVVLLCVDPKPVEEGSSRECQVTAFLNHYARHLTERGVKNVSLRLSVGEPAPQILRAIEEARADLVAMTTHGRSGLARLRFGSVAEEVLRQCVTPLLVVREPSKG
jgi:nucleotide-binding universal stress UspA family protein